LLQVRLSRPMRYRSMYEGQVPTRQDSPAHYMEQIQIALNLLGRRNLPHLDKLGHLDLLALLRSRIGFDLPGGRELTLGVIPDNSPAIRKTIRALYQELAALDFEVVAIMRQEHVLLPHPDTVLTAGDRIILIVSREAQETLAKYISPVRKLGDADAQPSSPDAS
jgi:TrkA-C domain